jgi:hypothetical protein
MLAQIRKLTHDPALTVLNEKERADLAKVDPSPDLHELTPMDLPVIARRPFTEVDGSVGQGRARLLRPTRASRSGTARPAPDRRRAAAHRLDNGKVIETSGSRWCSGAMIRSILHDGPIATSRR